MTARIPEVECGRHSSVRPEKASSTQAPSAEPSRLRVDFAAARTSLSTMRPSGPVPLTFARSTPSSLQPCAQQARPLHARFIGLFVALAEALTRGRPSSFLLGGAVSFSVSSPAQVFPSSAFDSCSSLVRLLRLLFLGCSSSSARFLAFGADERDLVADVNLAAFLDENFRERPVLRRLPFHGRLVGLDLRQHFACRNLVALLFLPRRRESPRSSCR